MRPTPAPGPDTSPAAGTRPRLLVLACVLVHAEAAGLGVAALLGVVALLEGADLGPVLAIVLTALGVAVLLEGAARGLWAGRRWARGPVITAQIMVAVAATTLWGTGSRLWGTALLVLAVTVAGALLTPSVVAATLGSRRTDAAG